MALVGVAREITRRKRVEAQLRASLREKEVLLKEIHHRVKNNLQVISSLLSLQASKLASDDMANILRESQTRVKSMALVHEELYQSDDFSRIDFADYAHRLTTSLFHTYRTDTTPIMLAVDVEDVFLTVDTAIPCGLDNQRTCHQCAEVCLSRQGTRKSGYPPGPGRGEPPADYCGRRHRAAREHRPGDGRVTRVAAGKHAYAATGRDIDGDAKRRNTVYGDLYRAGTGRDEGGELMKGRSRAGGRHCNPASGCGWAEGRRRSRESERAAADQTASQGE